MPQVLTRFAFLPTEELTTWRRYIPFDKVLTRIPPLKLIFVCLFRSSVRSTGRPRTARQKSSRSSSSSSAQRTTVRITPFATSVSPTWVLRTGLTAGGTLLWFWRSRGVSGTTVSTSSWCHNSDLLKENWLIIKAWAYFLSSLKTKLWKRLFGILCKKVSYFVKHPIQNRPKSCCNACLSVSPEEGEELWEGGDPHSVHELAGPRRSRGGAAPPQAEAPRQRLQELLQRPHRRPLQVRLVNKSVFYYQEHVGLEAIQQ